MIRFIIASLPGVFTTVGGQLQCILYALLQLGHIFWRSLPCGKNKSTCLILVLWHSRGNDSAKYQELT
jgi:hypothetical protein